MEGVLVSGTARVHGRRGVRALPRPDRAVESRSDLQELFAYPGHERDDDDEDDCPSSRTT